MTRFYVLLGDVVQSREIDDRAAFRQRLEEACRDVTARYPDGLYTDVTVLKGVDEIGAVLTSIADVYRIVTDLADATMPDRIRFALAYDQIDVGLDGTDVASMDGPAFHRADSLLERIERTALLFDAAIDEPPLETAIADEINLLLFLRQNRTDRQREIVERYETVGSQHAVAAELGISQQAVSNALGRAHWSLVNAIEARLQTTLETV